VGARLMNSVTISAEDPRSLRALQLAADMPQWLRCRTSEGELLYGIPSQRVPGLFHLASTNECTCADYRRNGLRSGRVGQYGNHFECKHVLAVRLQSILCSIRYLEAQPKLRRVK
jgi:hypothetical protein